MAHGITLQMRWAKRPAPTYVHEHPAPVKTKWGYVAGGAMTPHRGPSRDRSLPGKARIRARRAHRKAAR